MAPGIVGCESVGLAGVCAVVPAVRNVVPAAARAVVRKGVHVAVN